MAADICSVLAIANPHSSLALLDADEKGMDTPDGAQQITIINESVLYSLILRSKPPAGGKRGPYKS